MGWVEINGDQTYGNKKDFFNNIWVVENMLKDNIFKIT